MVCGCSLGVCRCHPVGSNGFNPVSVVQPWGVLGEAWSLGRGCVSPGMLQEAQGSLKRIESPLRPVSVFCKPYLILAHGAPHYLCVSPLTHSLNLSVPVSSFYFVPNPAPPSCVFLPVVALLPFWSARRPSSGRLTSVHSKGSALFFPRDSLQGSLIKPF